MSEYESPKLDFAPPPPVLWAWSCPNDGTLHWLHVARECHCGFSLAHLAHFDPLAERDEARAQRDALAEALGALIDDACSYICPSTGREGVPIPHSPRCIAARSALEKARGI